MANRSLTFRPFLTVLHVMAVLAGTFILTPAAFAQSNGDAAAGKKLTEFVCRNCHDISGNERPRNPPGGAPSFFEVAQKPETTEKSLHRFLSLPHGRMNIVQISGKEVDNAVAYIMSMKRK